MSKDTVLLVIDVQKGLIEPAYRSTEVLENINALLGQAHNSHTPVIYIQHDGPKGHGLEAGTATRAAVRAAAKDVTAGDKLDPKRTVAFVVRGGRGLAQRIQAVLRRTRG